MLHLQVLPFWACMYEHVYRHVTSTSKNLLHISIFQQNPPAISVPTYTQTGSVNTTSSSNYTVVYCTVMYATVLYSCFFMTKVLIITVEMYKHLYSEQIQNVIEN